MHKDTQYVKKAINKAFLELRKKGWFAEANFWCCQNCATSDIPNIYSDKYAFYHEQDYDRLKEYGNCHIAYAHANGEQVKQELENVGLEVEWDGLPSTRILVKKPVTN